MAITAAELSVRVSAAGVQETARALGDLGRQADELPGSFGKAASSIDKIGTSFEAVRTQASGMGAPILNASEAIAHLGGSSTSVQAVSIAMQSVADHIPAVTHAAQEAATATKNVGESRSVVASLGSAFDSAASHAQNLVKALAGIGLARQGIDAISDAAKGLGNLLGVGLNVQMENVTAQLKAFTKDGGAAADILKQIRTEADKTPFEFNEMAQSVTTLLPASKMANVALMDLVKTSEILAALHPEQGLQGAAFALREAVGGDFTSVIERFDLPRTVINNLKQQGVPAIDAVRQALKGMGADQELVSNLAETTSGRFSTFKDALASIQAVAGKPILTELNTQLQAAATWLDKNKASAQAFATAIGQAMAGAIQNTVAFVQTIGPTVQTMAIGIQQTVTAFQGLPTPIKAATVAVVGLGVALAVLSPEVAVVGALAAGFTWLAGKIGESNEPLKAVAATWTSLSDQLAGPAAAAAGTYSMALTQMTLAGKGAGEQQQFMEAEASRLQAQMVALSQSGDITSQAYLNLRGSFDAATAKLTEMGITTGVASDGQLHFAASAQAVAAAAQDQAKQLDAAKASAVPFGDVLQDIAEKAKKGGDAIAAAAGEIDKLTGSLTGTEQVLTRQTDALDAVGSAVQAAFSSKSAESVAFWAEQAHKAADASDLAGPPLDRLNQLIDQVAQGGPGAAGALSQLNELVKQSKAPIDDANKAYADQRQLTGDLAKEQLGLAGSLDQLRQSVDTFVTVFLASMGQIPPAAKGIADQIKQNFNIDLSPQAVLAATSYGGGLEQGLPRVSSAAAMLRDAVANGLAAVNAAGIGSNMGAALAAGLIGQVDNVYSAAKLLALKAQQGATDGLQIQSPSQVGLDIGANYGGAVATGVESKVGDVGDASLKLVASLDEIGPAVTTATEPLRSLAGNFDDVVTSVNYFAPYMEQAAGALESFGTVIATTMTPTRQIQQEIAAWNTELAKLKLQLAYTAPYTAEANAINQQIQLVDGLKARLESLIGVQQAEAAQQELSKTSLDRFNESLATIATSGANTTLFGKGGADIIAGLTAALDDPAAGAKVAASFAALMQNSVVVALPDIVPVSQQLQDALTAQLANPTPETMAAVQALLGHIQDEVQQQAANAGKLSADSYLAALNQGLMSANLKDMLGSSIGGAFDSLMQIITEGGKGASEAAAKLSLSVQSELGKLPDFLKGQFGTAYQQAMEQFIANPTGDAAEAVKTAAGKIHDALEVIPQGFAKLPGDVRANIISMVEAVQSGQISITDASQRVKDAVGLIPKGFSDMDAAVQQTIKNTVDAVLSGALSIEQGVKIIADATKAAADAAKKAAADAAQAAEDARKAVLTVTSGSHPLAGGSRPSGGEPYPTTEDTETVGGITHRVTHLSDGSTVDSYDTNDANSLPGTLNSFTAQDYLRNEFERKKKAAEKHASGAILPDLTYLFGANGAFRGTAAERGPEALAPLDRVTPRGGGDAGGGINLHVTVTGNHIYGAGGLDEIADQLTGRISANLGQRQQQLQRAGVRG